jgi:hypothetical protein
MRSSTRMQAPVRQPCLHAVAGRCLGNGAHEATVFTGEDRIAARDGGQRADRFERAGQPLHVQLFLPQPPGHCGTGAPGEHGNVLGQRRQAPRGLVRTQCERGMLQARAALFDVPTASRFQPPSGFLQALPQQGQPRLRAQGIQPQGRLVGTLGQRAQVLALQRLQAQVERAQAGAQLACIRHQQLGRGRGRGRAQVGGKIGQGEIRLVADGGHHRHCDAAIARTSDSSLKAHRSSSEPPRAIRMAS